MVKVGPKVVPSRDMPLKASDTERKGETTGVDSSERIGAAGSTGSVEKPVPDYIVAFSAEKSEGKSTYTPQEVKSKAKTLLSMGTLPPDQQVVLADILKEK
jgi:hypothetical protein